MIKIYNKSDLFNFANTNSGYSIINSYGLYAEAKKILISEINSKFDDIYDEDFIKLIKIIIDNKFHLIKEKKNRLLNLKNSLFLKDKVFNIFNLSDNEAFISDEENLGYPNFNWRLVRPNILGDVGPIHADKWFWDLNPSHSIPKMYKRIKIWIPLLQYPNEYSLLIKPGSHLEEFEYNFITEEKTNKRKPLISKNYYNLMEHALVNEDFLIIFNDKLLHGGCLVNHSRVSIEFTIAIKI